MGSGRSKSDNTRTGPGAKLTDSDILKSQSMISVSGKYNKQAQEVISVARDLYDEYGEIGEIKDLRVVTLSEKQQSVLGFWDGSDNISININMFSGALDEAYDKSAASGHNVSRGNKSAVQAVTAHEMGHALTSRIGSKIGVNDMNTISTKIVKEAAKETGHKGVVKMAGKISKYATASNAEALAEAFCDVYCNGNSAKRESKAIVKTMNKYLKS